MSAIGQDIEGELRSLESQLDIKSESHSVRRAGFDGRAETLTLVKFLIVGISAGVLKKIGESAWERLVDVIRRILNRSTAGAAYEAEVEVAVGSDRTYTKFVCRTNRLEEIDGLRAFRATLQRELLSNASLKGFGPVRYRLKETGSWSVENSSARNKEGTPGESD